MVSVILAGAGKARWCEASFSPAAAGEVITQLYPGTKFLCLHRSCPDVIRAGVTANPWGLAGSGLGQFAAVYPGSSTAAIAAYWAERTESLLRFQDAHPAACRRVRYEDLAVHPDQEAQEILAFLDLDEAVTALTHEAAAPAADTGAPLADAAVPASHLPQPLTARVNDLQARLGYPPIA